MLKKILFVGFIIINSLLFSQDITFDYTVTDCNMTIAIQNSDNSSAFSLDGDAIPSGSQIGVFYTDDNGNLMCGGASEWPIGTESFSVAAWGSEANLDNGFSAGEAFTWILSYYDENGEEQIHIADSFTMDSTPPFVTTYTCQGLTALLTVVFTSSCCSDSAACNYIESCEEEDLSSCDYEELYYDCDGNCLLDSDGDGVCDELEVTGCTDESAVNFNIIATDDDGSCQYILAGCTSEYASNYNIDANEDDGSCIFCNDVNASNYYSGEDDGSFCTLDEINNYTSESVPDGLADCCFYPNPGCIDDGSCWDGSNPNFEANGELDDYECGDKFSYFDEASGMMVYYESPFPGTPAANYNEDANTLIGVDYCYYFPACNDQNALNYGYNCNGENILEAALVVGFNIDYNAEPETESFTITYNGEVFDFSGSNNCCLYYGCTNPNADNFHDFDGIFYNNQPDEENLDFNGQIDLNLLYTLDGTYVSATTENPFPPDLPSSGFNVIDFFSQDDIDGDGIPNLQDDDQDGDESFIPYPDNSGEGVSIYAYLGISDPDDTDPCIVLACSSEDASYITTNYPNIDSESVENFIPFNNADGNNVVNDGSCQYYICTDPTALNYNEQLVENIENDDAFSDCVDIDYFDNQNYLIVDEDGDGVPDPGGDGFDDCCNYLGCTDPEAYNYDPLASQLQYVFTASVSDGSTIYSLIPILNDEGDVIGFEDICFPYIYGCLDGGVTDYTDEFGDGLADGMIAENYNDSDQDGLSNPFVTDDIPIYVLTNVNINNPWESFLIDENDLIELFEPFPDLENNPINSYNPLNLGGFSGANNNVNTESALDADGNPIIDPLNSVNPCEYIYGCQDPCYIEYYDVVEYDNEEAFNFLDVNNLLSESACNFIYDYGCTELIPPSILPTFDDGSCANLLIYGCTHPDAANYNPFATVNDCASCITSIEVDFELINPVCFDNLYGYFSFTVINGFGPFSYSLYDDLGSGIVLNQVVDKNIEIPFNNLPVGDYILEIIDFAGYSSIVTFSIIVPTDFMIDINQAGGWLSTIDGYESYNCTYVWTLDGEILVGAEYETYQIYPESSGLYGVTVTFEYPDGECVSNTVYYAYELFESSISNEDQFAVTCIPNPFVGAATINIENNQGTSLLFDLYDSFGKKIWNRERVINEEKSFVIQNLKPGIYYLYISGFGNVRVMPVVVLK